MPHKEAVVPYIEAVVPHMIANTATLKQTVLRVCSFTIRRSMV